MISILPAECIFADLTIRKEFVDDPPPPTIESKRISFKVEDGVRVYEGFETVTLHRVEGIKSLVYVERVPESSDES